MSDCGSLHGHQLHGFEKLSEEGRKTQNQHTKGEVEDVEPFARESNARDPETSEAESRKSCLRTPVNNFE